VIPCFGVHPWSAHLHASEQLLDSEEEAQGGTQAQESSSSTSSNSGDGHHSMHGAGQGGQQAAWGVRVCDMPSPMLDIPAQQAHEEKIQALLHSTPNRTWLARLRRLLRQHPDACVGKFGLDRSSIIPGTRARVTLEHQLRIARAHMAVAAEFQRPVSLHCVCATGPMQVGAHGRCSCWLELQHA
jgi:Tat protein secretion system quality control protein TatD with DNase activity